MGGGVDSEVDEDPSKPRIQVSKTNLFHISINRPNQNHKGSSFKMTALTIVNIVTTVIIAIFGALGSTDGSDPTFHDFSKTCSEISLPPLQGRWT